MKNFWAPWAYLSGHWCRNVLLNCDATGHWGQITMDVSLEDAQKQGAEILTGPCLAGFVNAHSHTFQRAMAGLAESASASGQDNFWSWRDRMYQLAQRITPKQLEVIATQLYAELLQNGYTHLCEFHYLHREITDSPDNKTTSLPTAMAEALVRAAQRVGVGLTMLPTLYTYAGFGQQPLRTDQARFQSNVAQILSLQRLFSELGEPLLNAGVALHSLRAVDAQSIVLIAQAMQDRIGPIHIHVSEQLQEVEDSIKHLGARPIEWLAKNRLLDARWNLVHATHTTPNELESIAQAGASVVLCPTTEANLGDGLFDYPTYKSLSGIWSIGSDSHVSRNFIEELRWLEYGQRLTHRKRTVAAGPLQSTGKALIDGSCSGAEQATGLPIGQIKIGCRADLLVFDKFSVLCNQLPPDLWLDQLLFSGSPTQPSKVLVAGHWRQRSSRELMDCQERFMATMQELWST